MRTCNNLLDTYLNNKRRFRENNTTTNNNLLRQLACVHNLMMIHLMNTFDWMSGIAHNLCICEKKSHAERLVLLLATIRSDSQSFIQSGSVVMWIKSLRVSRQFRHGMNFIVELLFALHFVTDDSVQFQCVHRGRNWASFGCSQNCIKFQIRTFWTKTGQYWIEVGRTSSNRPLSGCIWFGTPGPKIVCNSKTVRNIWCVFWFITFQSLVKHTHISRFHFQCLFSPSVWVSPHSPVWIGIRLREKKCEFMMNSSHNTKTWL